ncbi:uncharacterized protein [Parasteatoda tepidariorum]|uniref:uncharacterized protein n=1 Tax=Parasteatoda tepidariorum TaxID=114398 RepID=UPI0039BCB6EA
MLWNREISCEERSLYIRSCLLQVLLPFEVSAETHLRFSVHFSSVMSTQLRIVAVIFCLVSFYLVTSEAENDAGNDTCETCTPCQSCPACSTQQQDLLNGSLEVNFCESHCYRQKRIPPPDASSAQSEQSDSETSDSEKSASEVSDSEASASEASASEVSDSEASASEVSDSEASASEVSDSEASASEVSDSEASASHSRECETSGDCTPEKPAPGTICPPPKLVHCSHCFDNYKCPKCKPCICKTHPDPNHCPKCPKKKCKPKVCKICYNFKIEFLFFKI